MARRLFASPVTSAGPIRRHFTKPTLNVESSEPSTHEFEQSNFPDVLAITAEGQALKSLSQLAPRHEQPVTMWAKDESRQSN
jgi:hypothetical protein